MSNPQEASSWAKFWHNTKQGHTNIGSGYEPDKVQRTARDYLNIYGRAQIVNIGIGIGAVIGGAAAVVGGAVGYVLGFLSLQPEFLKRSLALMALGTLMIPTGALQVGISSVSLITDPIRLAWIKATKGDLSKVVLQEGRVVKTIEELNAPQEMVLKDSAKSRRGGLPDAMDIRLSSLDRKLDNIADKQRESLAQPIEKAVDSKFTTAEDAKRENKLAAENTRSLP